MSSLKQFAFFSIIFFFLLSFLILSLSVFNIPPNAGPEYNLDKLFYYGANIFFWLSAPYLLNKLLKKIIWKGDFKNFIGTKSVGIIEDIVTVSAYFIAIFILSAKLFPFRASAEVILLLIIAGVISIYLRPKLLKVSGSGFINSSRPFKIGDWISVLNYSSEKPITGEVTGFDRKSVQLKSEDNTLFMLPDSVISNSVIENYNAFSKEVRFSIPYSLSSDVDISQSRRILTAGTIHALINSFGDYTAIPEVLVNNIDKDATDYKIMAVFSPWKPYSPYKIKSGIITTISEHLENAGIKYSYLNDFNIIEHIELFRGLDKINADNLYKSAVRKFFPTNDTIINQGEDGSSMFVLIEGLLNVVIKTSEGKSIKAGLISPGQIFGEMSLFTGETRSATVTSLCDSVVLEITKDAFKNILDKKPDLVEDLSELIAERQSHNLKLLDDYLNRKESFVKKLVERIKIFFNL
jgi:small-conductance mechanosensitive channel